MLRILTKWAESLEDVFKNPQKHVRQRLYPFINVDNEIVIPRDGQGDPANDGINKILKALPVEYEHVKAKFKQILKSNYKFMAMFLGPDQ